MNRTVRPVLATLVAVLGCLGVTCTAQAGTYEVLGCHSDGRSDAWQPYVNNGATAAYKECPGNVLTNGHTSDGMIVRNTGDANTPAPAFSAGQMMFEAPPGARIVRIRGEAQMLANGSWQAGIHDETNNRWLWCGPGCSSTFGSNVAFDVGGISSSRVGALLICGASSCPRSGGLQGYVKLTNVVVTIADDSPPSVSIAETGLASAGWHRGDQPVVAQLSDNVGIRSYEAVLGDDRVYSENSQGCNPWSTRPCPDVDARPSIRTTSVPDGTRTLTIRARDSASNLSEVSRVVHIDNRAPGPPEAFAVGGGDRWRAKDQFAVTWRNPEAGDSAPIAGAGYTLCPADDASSKGSCLTSSFEGVDVSIARLQVPGPGDWRLRLWLRDAAGNEDRSTAQVVPLRFDSDSPTAAIRLPVAEDPTRIHLISNDPTSGLERGSIEVRRRGEDNWRILETAREPNGFAASIPDEILPDGTYDIRGLVADRADNERTTDRTEDGQPAALVLPARVKTRLAVGKSVLLRKGRGGKLRRKLVVSPKISYGRVLRLSGRLTTPGANPLPERTIEVTQRLELPNAPWQPVGTVETSETGRFTYRAGSGPSRSLRFRYGGTPAIRGRTSDVRLRVRAATSLRPNRNSVVNGEDVVFRGRLKGRPLSPASKLVQLQAYTRGRWATFANPRANPMSGLWTYRYRFAATRGRVVYRIRAVIPREASYPFETGRSRTVRVQVRGL